MALVGAKWRWLASKWRWLAINRLWLAEHRIGEPPRPSDRTPQSQSAEGCTAPTTPQVEQRQHVRHCLCLVFSTAFAAKTVPLPGVVHCLRG